MSARFKLLYNVIIYIEKIPCQLYVVTPGLNLQDSLYMLLLNYGNMKNYHLLSNKICDLIKFNQHEYKKYLLVDVF